MWKMGDWKKAISMFLAAAMLFSMDVPLTVSAAESEDIPVYEVSAAESEEIPVYEASAISEEAVTDAPALYDAPTPIGTTGISYTYDSEAKKLTLTGTGELKGVYVPEDGAIPAYYVSPIREIYDTIKGSNTSFVFETIEFKNCKLTGHMDYLFYKIPVKNINCEGLDTSGVTQMQRVFEACTELTSLDVSGCDTQGVSEMNGLFNGCSRLTSLDLSGFNTKNVSGMEDMFSGCSSLSSLTLGEGFKTGYAKNMAGMFRNCSALDSLDLSSFDTKYVTDMKDMFSGCSSLATLNIAGWDTGNVTDMSGMFSGCNNVASLAVNGFKTDKVTDMSNMFANCQNLSALQLPYFINNKTTDMSNMFSNCYNLRTLDISKLETSFVKDMSGMFSGCRSLTELKLSSFDTRAVTAMKKMFSDCTKLTTIVFTDNDALKANQFDTGNVKDMSFMFYNCSSLTVLNLSDFSLHESEKKGFDTSSVTDMSSMFSGCAKLVKLNLGSFDTSKVTVQSKMEEIFYNCTQISEIKTPKKMGSATASLPVTLKDENNDEYTALDSGNIGKTLTSYKQDAVYTIHFDGNGADAGTMEDQKMEIGMEKPLMSNTYTKTDYVFFGWTTDPDGNGDFYKDGEPVNNLTTTAGGTVTLYAKWEKAFGDIGKTNGIHWTYDVIKEVLTLTGTDTLTGILYKEDEEDEGVYLNPFKDISDKMTISGIVFKNCKLTGSAAYLFKNMTTLKTIDFKGINTADVTDMSYMFFGCTGLENLDLNGFISGKVTNMREMFSGCNKLRNVILTGSDTGAVTDMGGLFNGCSFLVGLPGETVIGKPNEYELDLSSLNTQSVKDMSRMFADCVNVNNLKLDTDKFKTASVTNMSEMFFNCKNLKRLDLSTFNTAAVTSMKAMFKSCESLEELNVSGFNTEQVTDFSEMFRGCSFSRLDISSFSIGKKITATNMFYGFQPSEINAPKTVETEIRLSRNYWDADGVKYRELSSENAGKTLKVDESFIYYYVVFDGNSDDAAGTMEEQAFKLEEEKELTENAFSRVGYTFTGWNTVADGSGTAYADKESVKNLSDAVGIDVRLYAQWIENQYTIKFDGNGSTGGTVADMTECVYGKKYNLTENAYVRTAYEFAGWNSKADGTGEAYEDKAEIESLTAEKDGVVTLYAKWIPVKYIITYNLDGGVNSSSNPGTYDILTDTIVLGTPTKPDHYFVGWYSDFAFTTRVTEIPKGSIGNMTFFARWKRIVYRITYCMNGGVNNPENLLFYDENDTITFADPTRPGYTFGGWYSDITLKKKIKEIKKGSAGDKIVYAKWTPNKYTVNFDGNGADKGSVKPMKKRTYGTAFTLSANKFKKSGYSFAGWNTKADGSGTHYRNKADVENLTEEKDGTVTLYAQWRLGGYSITYNVKGGVNDDANPDNYDENSSTIVLKDPVRPGYTFAGWFTNSKCKSKSQITQIDSGSKGDKTLYAKWKANKYTIEFNYNVSDNDVISPVQGSMKDMKNRVYGKKYKLSANKLKRHGYTFAGWNTKADGTGIAYKNKASVKNLAAEPDGKAVLYAQWLLVQYNINYKNVFYYYDDEEGDVSDGNPFSYNVKTATIVLNDAVKSGFTFEGWYTDAKFKEKNKVTEIPIGSKGKKTLYAKFTAHKYTIKFDPNGASGDMAPMENCKCGWIYMLTPNKFKAEGYTFAGWNLRADGRGRKFRDRESINDLTPEDGGTVTLYAQWKEK